nr:O-antigen ligase family protein [Thiocapsa sp. KS1]
MAGFLAQRSMTTRRGAKPATTAIPIEPGLVPNALAWLQVWVIGSVAAILMIMMGGVYPLPRALAGAAIAGLFFLTWSWRLARGAGADARDLGWLWVWLAVSGWIGLQLLPLPREVFEWIGAYPPDLLAQYPELPITRLSPNIAATLGYWGMFTTYWAAASLVAALPRRQLAVLVGILVALVFAEALYGFIAHMGRFETVLGLWPAPADHGVVVGTFWNRNHLAGLLALGWPLGIAYLLFGARMRPVRVHEVRYLLVLVFSLAMALALFNSLSRLGTASALFGLLVFVLLARANRVGRASGLERLWLFSAGLVALGLAIAFGLAPLLLRYSAVVTDTGRLEALLPLAHLPAKTWIAGAGAGGFEDIFKLVQPASLPPTFDYLHNDWVQFVLEFGVLGTVPVTVALAVWWRRAGPSQLSRLRAGAAGGIAAIALHSLGDFNLQIPGTAFAFWLVVGVLCNRALERDAIELGAARVGNRANVPAFGSFAGSHEEPVPTSPLHREGVEDYRRPTGLRLGRPAIR